MELGIALELLTSCPSPPGVLSSEGGSDLKKNDLREVARMELLLWLATSFSHHPQCPSYKLCCHPSPVVFVEPPSFLLYL